MIHSPHKHWQATEVFNTKDVKAFKIEATDTKAKEIWGDFQSLCNKLEEGYTFSTHHRISTREHTWVVHADLLTPSIRAQLAALKLLPPLTPPPAPSEK